MTKAEGAYLGRVAALGCILCQKLGYGLYQQPSMPSDQGPDFAKANMAMGMLGMGGMGGMGQKPQQPVAVPQMAGGGGGNTRGIFSSLMQSGSPRHVNPTLGILGNFLG